MLKVSRTYNINIQVHDGLGTHGVDISTSDNLQTLMERLALVFRRATTSILLGYEAPWSLKVGSKKTPSFINSQKALREFWLAFDRYVGILKNGKSKKDPASVAILFRNMHDVAQVRHIMFEVIN